MIPPTLELELALMRDGAGLVAGIDEVGRGALAGPVSVGVALIDASVGPIPAGLTDSKLLSASARARMVPLVQSWAVASAVGHATAIEIDEVGIIAALRLAALRALSALPVAPDAVILDGSHDWLTPSEDLFSTSDITPTPPVTMRIKADQSCAAVSAASVVAKVERDGVMTLLDEQFPGYGFAGHKGYGSAAHREAIRTLGASEVHRRSWNLL